MHGFWNSEIYLTLFNFSSKHLMVANLDFLTNNPSLVKLLCGPCLVQDQEILLTPILLIPLFILLRRVLPCISSKVRPCLNNLFRLPSKGCKEQFLFQVSVLRLIKKIIINQNYFISMCIVSIYAHNEKLLLARANGKNTSLIKFWKNILL